MTVQKFLLMIIVLAFCSCEDPKVDRTQQQKTPATGQTPATHHINNESLLSKLADNIHFIGDSLLKGKASLLNHIVKTYQSDTCGIVAYEDSSLKQQFEGAKGIGDLNHDKVADTVVVLPRINYCDDGDSYYFFDTTLPRLYADSSRYKWVLC